MPQFLRVLLRRLAELISRKYLFILLAFLALLCLTLLISRIYLFIVLLFGFHSAAVALSWPLRVTRAAIEARALPCPLRPRAPPTLTNCILISAHIFSFI